MTLSFRRTSVLDQARRELETQLDQLRRESQALSAAAKQFSPSPETNNRIWRNVMLRNAADALVSYVDCRRLHTTGTVEVPALLLVNLQRAVEAYEHERA